MDYSINWFVKIIADDNTVSICIFLTNFLNRVNHYFVSLLLNVLKHMCGDLVNYVAFFVFLLKNFLLVYFP